MTFMSYNDEDLSVKADITPKNTMKINVDTIIENKKRSISIDAKLKNIISELPDETLNYLFRIISIELEDVRGLKNKE